MKIHLVSFAGIAGITLVAVALLASNEESEGQDRLRIAYFPNIGHAVPITGIENGFFQSQIGLDVDVKTRVFDSGPQVIEALFADSVDVAYVGPGPAINGFLNSEQNRIRVLSGAASGGSSFVVHQDSEITTAKDFDGKKIAAPQIGNTQDVSLRHYLDENGLQTTERGGSVTVYNIPNPDIYTLFVKGEIDGAWVTEPWATILESELGGMRLFYEEELWEDGQFASVLLIGNTDYVEKNPEIIKNLLDAHEYTVQWIRQNPEGTRNAFNQFLTETLGRPLPDQIVDTALSNLEVTSDPIIDSMYVFAERAYELGYLGRNGYNMTEIMYNGNPEEDEIGET